MLKRATNSQAALLRRKAVHQLTSQGISVPFRALLGVSLPSGSCITTKQDEIESVCQEIRQAVGKTRLLQRQDDNQDQEHDHQWCLEDFQLGKPIAEGCAAMVYSAKIKKMHAYEYNFPLAINDV